MRGLNALSFATSPPGCKPRLTHDEGSLPADLPLFSVGAFCHNLISFHSVAFFLGSLHEGLANHPRPKERLHCHLGGLHKVVQCGGKSNDLLGFSHAAFGEQRVHATRELHLVSFGVLYSKVTMFNLRLEALPRVIRHIQGRCEVMESVLPVWLSLPLMRWMDEIHFAPL